MGRKVHPIVYRLGVNKEWDSRYFALHWGFTPFIKIDEAIRNYLTKTFQKGVIEKVLFEHSSNKFRAIIYTPRPGLVVGRQGAQTKLIEKKINQIIESSRTFLKSQNKVKQLHKEKQPLISIEIREVKDSEASASIVAQDIAVQLERRMPFRKTIKGMLAKIMRNKNKSKRKARWGRNSSVRMGGGWQCTFTNSSL